MSKKLKTLICALTAGMMLTTSLGLTASADELNADGSAAATETVLNADGSEAKATETPETVNGADVAEDEADAERLADEGAGAEAAPEPTEVSKSYDDDTYYQNALKVCSALGIITGYDDGSVKPESTVTRAEMATIILRMIAHSGTSAYQNIFTDVTGEHWAAGTIQTAVEQSIVNGMGDGTFIPDGPVKYEQVIKMIVCAMNYGTDAENAGGYPQGYLAVGGSTLKLLTSVNGSSGEDMPRGEVIKSVYNALKASYRGIKEFKDGYPVYETRDTLGIEKFDMYEEEGVLTTTPTITIASGSKTKEGVITIDGVDYKCDFNVDQYVATKVKFYYIDDKSDDNKVIAMFSMGRSVENKFDANDIDTIETTGANPVIKVYSSANASTTKTYKIKDATFVYNDTIVTTADFARYRDASAMTYDEFLKPDVGTMRIVDYDNDGVYDIVFVDSYETMLVTNATSEKLNGKIGGVNTTIEYDLDDKGYEIHVTKNDVSASVKNLKKNDVASIKRNLAGDKLTIVVTGESVTGSVTATGTEDGEITATINGQVYKVDKNAVADIKTGISGTFYLDMFDRVGYASLDGALAENENYAYIAKAYYNDESELVIRLYTQEGTQVEAKPSGSIKYWAPNASASTKSPGEAKLYNDLSKESNYVQCGSQPVKLCKYTINGSGEISKLYVATGIEKVSESDYNDALVIYTKKNSDDSYTANLRNVSAIGGTLNGYTRHDGIPGFKVPNSASDRGSGANYSVSAVTASSYKNYDNGVDRDFAIGGFTSGSTKTAQILVEFSTSSTSMW
ncbi:MAG: S-layer homology domain-containing protein, partial [Clostridia bacterium]|nr:S-layer homology domain-containing protein [Clostridia bacterium]